MKLLVTTPEAPTESRMDMHQNARLTLHCRELLVERVLRGRPKIQVAADFWISVTTVSKWVRRFQAEGHAGLRDRSCRPQRCPAATVRELELAVLALRRQRLTLVSIATQLRLSRASGPMRGPTTARASGSPNYRACSTTTTGTDPTPAWPATHVQTRPHEEQSRETSHLAAIRRSRCCSDAGRRSIPRRVADQGARAGPVA